MSGLSAGDIVELAAAVETDEARRAGAALHGQQQGGGGEEGGESLHAWLSLQWQSLRV